MPAFDRPKYDARVEELVAGGLDRDLAEQEAWLEQRPGGDLIIGEEKD